MQLAQHPSRSTGMPMSADAAQAGTHADAGVVLIHGFNGTPGDMAGLDARLAHLGYGTQIVHLPGHSGRLSEMATATWDDWRAAAHGAVRHALARHDRVVVVGHSLGGALALAVAAAEPTVAGVVALCPPCQLRRGLPEAIGMVRRFVPYVPALRYDMNGTLAERWHLRHSHAYAWVPLRTVHRLCQGLTELRGELGAVRAPALIVCARHDHVVPMEDGVEAYLRLGSARKELLVLSRSYHLVLQDCQRELVTERVRHFCARVAPVAQSGPRPEART